METKQGKTSINKMQPRGCSTPQPSHPTLTVKAMLFDYINIPAVLQYFEGAGPTDIEGRNIAIILWTCLLPLTCCIWTYLHPNMASRNLRLDGLGERLKLMLLMVVAPELILIWAVRQFIAAREIMVTYNKERPGTLSVLQKDI